MYKCEQWYVYVFRFTDPRRCANMCVRACGKVGVEEGREGALRIFMRGLPCETPSRSSFSFRRLAPSLPSLLSDLFPAPSPFLSILSWSWATSRSNSFSYRNNSRLLESWTESCEWTNEQKWLTLVARRNMSISRFSEEIWNGVFLLPLRHREAI